MKIDGLAHSTSLKTDLETNFTRIPNIQSASASIRTGNLLVHYTGQLTWKQVCSMVSDYLAERSANPASTTGINSPEQRQPPKIKTLKKKTRLPVPVIPAPQIPWYQKDRLAVLKLLDCDRQKGITTLQAKQRLRDWGPNKISEIRGRSLPRMLFDQISSAPLLLLAIQGAVAALTGGLIEAALVSGVIAANVSVGCMIDARVQRRILALRQAARPVAVVSRDGEHLEIPGEKVVIGDLLVLTPGTYVAADSRIIKASNLKLDESALTGESIPVDKSSMPIRHTQRSLADQGNMAFMGTLVVGGKGLAAVVATGLNTEYGKMLALTTETFPPQTPIIHQLEKLSRKLLMAGGLIAAIVLGLRLWRGFSVLESLKFALPLGASAMPAALPTAAAANLAVGIKRLKKNSVSIRQLFALETLGSVNVICFDKTGTITRGRITVLEIYAGGRRLQVKHRQFVEDGRAVDPLAAAGMEELMKACVLCNEAKIEFGASGKPTFKGSPTETALLYLALLAETDVPQIYRHRRLESVKHRGKHRRRMVTVHRKRDGSARISVKGDPMEVAAMCRWQLKDGNRLPLTDAVLSDIEIRNESMAAEALRVLGFAYKVVLPGKEIDIEQDLVWIGMVGMAEPIRLGVRHLIQDLNRAGIDTVMITGDQALTAYAVARKVRLAGGKEPKVMDSAQFDTLKPDLLEAIVRDVQVYSRVNPSQKLQIVMALQKRGNTVAMTGDGINDGPALRAADIGIAMGLGGTDVAREVADIVLDNDDISAIRPAVSNGRRAYANLKSSFHYCLASNFSEIILLTTASALTVSTPLIDAQPLGINVFAEILPALSLLVEPAPGDITEMPAGDPDSPLFDIEDATRITTDAMVMAGSALTAYGCGALRYGPGIRSAALAHESLTAARLLHVYNCRRNGRRSGFNPYLTLATAASFGLQLLPFFAPGVGRLLKIPALSLTDLAIAGANAGLALVVNKHLRKDW